MRKIKSEITIIFLTGVWQNTSSCLLCESKNREHQKYFWNVIAFEIMRKSHARKLNCKQ